MGEVSPASFADVTFALIQRISPRKLKRSDIPNETFHALREMVSAELSSISSSFVTTIPTNVASNEHLTETVVDSSKINSGLYDDDDSRMSGCESSEGSQSQYSVEDELSKHTFKGPGRVAGYSSSTSSQSQLATTTKPLKQSTRARRLTELRASRRLANETKEAHLFTCSEEDLPKVFEQWYNNLLDSGDPPVRCYHLVVNSLTKFFIVNTFGNTVEAMVCDFLRNHVIRSCAELNSQYDGSSTADGERRLRELQLQVLLELYASYLDSANAPPRLLDIVRKMRIVYFIASASKMRSFLEEQIADNFFHLTPRLVADVFDELCIQLPDDMEEYDSVWNKDDDLSFPLFQQKETNATQLQQLNQLIQEIRSPDEESVNGKTNAKALKRKIRPEVEKKVSTVTKSPFRGRKRRRRYPRAIPETPEEKLRTIVKEETTEVVKATPGTKLCRNTRRRKSKEMTQLIRISEERAKIPRAAALASAKASRAIVQASQCPLPTSRDCLLGLHTPPPRAQRAKSNLLSKFTNLSSDDSTKGREDDGEASTRLLRSCTAALSSPPCKRVPEPKSASSEPSEKGTRLCYPDPSSSDPPSEIDEIVGKEHLERFQRRVEEINNIDDVDDNEVYYEQITQRKNLFDEDIINSTSGKSMQQNRTRRVIRPSSAAHLAHLLLNVNNDTPLEVWKLPRGLISPEKMPRMIRTGVSAVKMKKIQRMRDQCRATSPTSSRQSEHSGES
ncbi:hypothetical protein KIN20_005480 [Parelaphostrongylus tenuis]|uniref:Treslin STD domain-containing protein n=1 Tax=Parelaphostrongylus tenuis TaxID=148309 RepID=A0AAD5QG28_PARTN|nr:hypothetical protein KIN20_005480 [Parelaphostrongylus tenuis]